MRNATPVLPFKTRRPTRRHYFLRVHFRPFSFFMRTTRAKINPDYNSTQYCNTETVFVYIPLPPDQHHISDVANWR